MGLLRAHASAVLIGAGTLRATPTHRWTAEHAYPHAAPEFATLRRKRRLAADLELVVAIASGHLPANHPALEAGAVIVTTKAGARRLIGRLPRGCTILALSDGERIDPGTLVAAVRGRGHPTCSPAWSYSRDGARGASWSAYAGRRPWCSCATGSILEPGNRHR